MTVDPIASITADATRLATGWRTARHVTAPSLITQLEHDLADRTPTPDGPTRGDASESRPPAADEPMTALLAIRDLARQYADRIRHANPTDAHVLAALPAIAATLPADDLAQLVDDLAAVRAQAEEALTWRHPAYRLDGYCPLCSGHGTIHVRFAPDALDVQPTDATCDACLARWDADQLGLLARLLDDNDPP